MDEKEVSVHQSLMNKAYELWCKDEDSKSMSYESFLDCVESELGSLHRMAVITGNLNYQVENGGFSQWDGNEYSCTLEELINFFKSLYDNNLENKSIKKINRILEEINEIFEWKDDCDYIIGRMSHEAKMFIEEIYDENIDEKLDEEVGNKLSDLDNEYYKINEELNKILEEYFSTEINKISNE